VRHVVRLRHYRTLLSQKILVEVPLKAPPYCWFALHYLLASFVFPIEAVTLKPYRARSATQAANVPAAL
jgi:hypothetical protein